MAISEFDLIQRYFTSSETINPANQLSVGDDCALISIPDNHQLAITVDTMVEGVHFFAGADPGQLGRKLLAVNLSDLADKVITLLKSSSKIKYSENLVFMRPLLTPNIDKARNELGWIPVITLDKGLVLTIYELRAVKGLKGVEHAIGK